MSDSEDPELGKTHGILRDALRGDGTARGELLERLRPRLLLWVSTRLSPELRARHEDEDVVQEILLSVHRSLDAFTDQGERAFFGWLFRVAENRLRDLADHAGAKKRRPVDPRSFSQTSPSSAAMRAESFLRLHEALSSLSEDHRRVIRLRRLEERDTPEVAALLGRSENAVRILYCRALRALRQAMESESGDSVK